LNERIYLYPEVQNLIGLSRTTIWREVKAKRFPAPVSTSPNRVGFRETDIRAWMAARKPKHAA
jgi:prophage regulatory protein